MQQDKNKALFIAEKIFAEIVFDVQKLEGMPFTLPEVQTYIQGVTVGGHKVSDEKKLQRQIDGWRRVIELVQEDRFVLTKEIACDLQEIIAKDEALEVGRFRSGMVSIAGTEHRPPEAAGLDRLFTGMIGSILEMEDVREQAYRIHLDMARNQFFYDGNKRTGLFMLNGHLMSHGYAPLSIPAKRQLTYNAGMLLFYDSGERSGMTDFLRQCHEAMYDKFK